MKRDEPTFLLNSKNGEDAGAERNSQESSSISEKKYLDEIYDMEIVVFQLGKEYYGIDIDHIVEIEILPAITRIPRSKDFVMGISTLRGNLFPVLNINKIFSFPVNPPDINTRLIIFQFDGEMISFCVDNVLGVAKAKQSELVLVKKAMKLKQDFYNGFFPYKGTFIIYLNLKRIIESNLLQNFYNERKTS